MKPGPTGRWERTWSDSDNSFLREHAATMPYSDIACRLGKTAVSVRQQAHRLGVRREHLWTLEDDSLVREFYPVESGEQVAFRLPGRSAAAVRHRARALGVQGRSYRERARRGQDASNWTGFGERKAEYMREYQREYRQRPEARERKRARSRLDNNLRRDRTRGSFTTEEWEQRKAEYGGCCAYCFRPSESLEIEHLVPVCRGGSNTIDNIVPACPDCNRTKGTRTFIEFMEVTRA